jgi:hypothetical protein
MILPRSIRMTPSRRAPKDASEDPGGSPSRLSPGQLMEDRPLAAYGPMHRCL